MRVRQDKGCLRRVGIKYTDIQKGLLTHSASGNEQVSKVEYMLWFQVFLAPNERLLLS